MFIVNLFVVLVVFTGMAGLLALCQWAVNHYFPFDPSDNLFRPEDFSDYEYCRMVVLPEKVCWYCQQAPATTRNGVCEPCEKFQNEAMWDAHLASQSDL